MTLPDLRTLRGPDGEPISLTDLPEESGRVVAFATDLIPDRYMGFSVLTTLGPYPPEDPQRSVETGMKALYVSMVPTTPQARVIVEAGGGGEIRAYTPIAEAGVRLFEHDEQMRAEICESTFAEAKKLIAETLTRTKGA